MAKLDSAERVQLICQLGTDNPWPCSRPDYPFVDQGWLVDSTRELLKRTIAEARPQLVLELGAWLGKSTRFILAHAPAAHVISVDLWDPVRLRGWIASKHPHLSVIVEHCHEQFLANCWDERDRITPMRCESLAAIAKLAALRLSPDLIYLDTSHTYQDTRKELVAIDGAFPHAVLVGDDWQWRAAPDEDGGPVARAVRDHYKRERARIDVHGNGWRRLKICDKS